MANGAISFFLANKIQDALFGGINVAPPTKHIGYTMTASGANGFGTEMTGANYSRIPTLPSVWSVSTAGVATNIADIELPRASGAQGNPVSLVVYDSSVGGNPLIWIPINGELTIQNRNSLIIPAGVITHRFTAASHYSQYWRSSIMNFLFLGTPLPLEPILWAGYCSTAATTTASGLEPTAIEYNRQSLNNNKSSFTTAVNGGLKTLIDLQFPESGSAQGNISHVALFGSEDGGPYLCSAPLSQTVSMGVNTQMVLRANSFTFQLN